jgi:uncharacterized membrane protein YbhN (UPF0104 family)
VNKKQLFIALITVGSLLFIGYSMDRSIDTYTGIIQQFELLNLLAVLAMFTCSLFIASIYHAVIVKSIHPAPLSWLEIICSYTQSQIIRYLPGKVFGLITQSVRLNHAVPAKIIWEANLIQLVSNSLNTCIVLTAAIIFFLTNSAIFSLASFLLLFIIISVLKRHSISNLFQKVIHMLSQRFSMDTEEARPIPPKNIITIIGLLNLEWLIYLVAWLAIATELPYVSALYLGVIYAASTLIGILVFVMPNGILVREGSFIFIGTTLGLASADSLLVYSVLLRLLFTGAEIFLYLISEIYLKITNPHPRPGIIFRLAKSFNWRSLTGK